jgi:ribonuclease Z
MNFELNILGCGSAKPTTRHQPTSQILNVRGKLFMIDCGEGVQAQMQKMGLSMMSVGHIFISHNHGDHVFGLPGLIGTMDLLGRTAELHIHGPQQVGELLDFLQRTYYSDIQYEVLFHPVDTRVHDLVYEDRSITVHSIPLKHRLPTCGYLFREKPTLPHIRRDMIDMYGIPVSQINNIKAGQGYTLADGTVIPHEQLVTPPDKPRSYAYCSDTRYMPLLHQMVKGVDTLYHESTYGEDNLQMAQKYNHSTARQAAMVARDAGVGQLVLGHYSSRYEDETVLLNEAREVFENVRLSNEMDVINV